MKLDRDDTLFSYRKKKKLDAQITEKRSTIVTLAFSRNQQATNYTFYCVQFD